ncbi:hypothetical protein PUR29_34545 [Methylobacterium ajmalii]|uniref:Uncharacterized protein n=1 Tax=Methylobacterium ajmalii TaxID=2738439 RepID=A0ABV0A474_9HYPH
MIDLPKTKEEAKQIGARAFLTGEPCSHGHVAPRYTLNSRCKTCAAESVARQKAANPEKFAERIRKATAKWQAANPEATKAWRDQNRSSMNAATTRYRQRNTEKYNETVRQRRERDPGPSRRAALAWQQKNLDKKLALNSERRAAKLNATPPWLTREHRNEIAAMHREARRLSKETGIPHHVDHIEALRGELSCGLHVPWNLQILTAVDNLKKGNRLRAA